MVRFFKKYHKWPSLVFTLFILMFAISGIILNHRSLLSSVDIQRKWLPAAYRYKNWNMAAVRGYLKTEPNRMLVFGNIGVWLTDSAFSRFTSLNKGFPEGMDNRKVSSLAFSTRRGLFAATLFGLYQLDPAAGAWREIPLPVREQRIVRVLFKGDSLMVLTRSHLLLSTAERPGRFQILRVPPATDDDRRTGLFKTLWVIHSGEIYGTAGRLLVDLVGLTFIIICLTGLIWFLAPPLLKHVNVRMKEGIRRFNLLSLRWHNRLGSWLVALLLLTTLTGMFLRPPLLIPIANARINKLRYTELDDPNAWFDRFRDLVYDDSVHRFLFATSEGIYFCPEALDVRLQRFSSQPPVSVMGINVFEMVRPGKFLVGSFSGIFLWEPSNGHMEDYFTKTVYSDPGTSGSPFGDVSVAGYIRTSPVSDVIFDYAGGAIVLSGNKNFPTMPPQILKASPISLWNIALEVHTGRIWEPLIGPFYILLVPLTGLATLFIIVTGFFSWYLKRKPSQASDFISRRLRNTIFSRQPE